MRLALYQPEIPQNTGTLLRLCACMGIPMDIIEPCGFIFNDRRIKRSGMDYLDNVDITRHLNWQAFREKETTKRVVLLAPKGESSYLDFSYQVGDTLLLGRESDGVPDSVFQSCEASVYIPMQSGFRSINVAVAAAMVVGEALRQTNLFPGS